MGWGVIREVDETPDFDGIEERGFDHRVAPARAIQSHRHRQVHGISSVVISIECEETRHDGIPFTEQSNGTQAGWGKKQQPTFCSRRGIA